MASDSSLTIEPLANPENTGLGDLSIHENSVETPSVTETSGSSLNPVRQQQPDSLIDDPNFTARRNNIAAAVRSILAEIGVNGDDEGLAKTPDRYAKALLFFTEGYSQRVADVVGSAIFRVNTSELVIVRNIDIHSMCEHHMVPFTGKAHIGYIPDGKVLGLSKLVRVAEVFTRRLQVQERLTQQITAGIDEVLRPLGVAVVVECTHMCMVMRGVQKVGTTTLTQSMTGLLKDDHEQQQRFFTLLGLGQRH